MLRISRGVYQILFETPLDLTKFLLTLSKPNKTVDITIQQDLQTEDLVYELHHIYMF